MSSPTGSPRRVTGRVSRERGEAWLIEFEFRIQLPGLSKHFQFSKSSSPLFVAIGSCDIAALDSVSTLMM